MPLLLVGVVMHQTNIALVVVLLLGAAACSGGEDATVNTDSARACVDQLGKISASMSAMDASEVAHSIVALLSASQSVVVPKDIADPTYGIETSISLPFSGTGTCTEASCTFINYRAEVTLTATYTIDGSITRSGDTITFDITYDRISKGGSMQWELDGTVTSTATQLDGAIHGHGTTGGPYTSIHVTWDDTIDLNAVALDAQACPTGGSVHGRIRYTDDPTMPLAGGHRWAPSFEVQGTAVFGPGCDAAK